jgi:hypothetical protein
LIGGEDIQDIRINPSLSATNPAQAGFLHFREGFESRRRGFDKWSSATLKARVIEPAPD